MKKMLVRAAVLAMFTAGIATATGIAGAGSALACEAQPARSAKLASSLPQVNFGNKGANVVALQLALRQEGYHLQGTGVYSVNTLAAVKDFQRRHGIKASGIVGAKTWQALVGKKSKANTEAAVPLPKFSITPGERNEYKMFVLGNTMVRISFLIDRPHDQNQSLYGPAAQNAVKEFQRRAGIKPSGIVGPKTWAAMYKAVSVSGGWGC